MHGWTRRLAGPDALEASVGQMLVFQKGSTSQVIWLHNGWRNGMGLSFKNDMPPSLEKHLSNLV